MGLASGDGGGVMGTGDGEIGMGGNIVQASDGEKGCIELTVVECAGADPEHEIDDGTVTVKNVDKGGADGRENVELTEEIVGGETDEAAVSVDDFGAIKAAVVGTEAAGSSEGHDGVGLPV